MDIDTAQKLEALLEETVPEDIKLAAREVFDSVVSSLVGERVVSPTSLTPSQHPFGNEHIISPPTNIWRFLRPQRARSQSRSRSRTRRYRRSRSRSRYATRNQKNRSRSRGKKMRGGTYQVGGWRWFGWIRPNRSTVYPLDDDKGWAEKTTDVIASLDLFISDVNAVIEKLIHSKVFSVILYSVLGAAAAYVVVNDYTMYAAIRAKVIEWMGLNGKMILERTLDIPHHANSPQYFVPGDQYIVTDTARMQLASRIASVEKNVLRVQSAFLLAIPLLLYIVRSLASWINGIRTRS